MSEPPGMPHDGDRLLIDLVRDLAPSTTQGLQDEIASCVEWPTGDFNVRQQFEYLSAAEVVVLNRLTAFAAEMSKAEWLWYLRRAPNAVFESRHHYDTGGGYNRNLAEAITAIGGATTSERYLGKGEYSQHWTTLVGLAKLIAGANHLAGIQWLKTCAARGLALTWDVESKWPLPHLSEADEFALRRYYVRSRSKESLFGTAGSEFRTQLDTCKDPGAVGLVFRCTPRLEAIEFVGHNGHRSVPTLRTYWLNIVGLDALRQLGARAAHHGVRWPSPAFWAAAMLLATVKNSVETRSTYLLSLLQFGYISVEADLILEEIEAAIPPVAEGLGLAKAECPAPEVLWSLLCDWTPCADPLRMGPLVRIDGNLALVDVHAATFELVAGSSFPQEQGQVGNLRGKHFEEQVQLEIDKTGWKPGALATLRGRTLRIDGKMITDVDAIAFLGRQVLLVSAKSRVKTNDERAGGHRAIRNAGAMVSSACQAAAKIAALLRQRPVGDNYDFSGLDVSIVVCTPWAVFTTDCLTWAPVLEGLPASVTLDELKEFLVDGCISYSRE